MIECRCHLGPGLPRTIDPCIHSLIDILHFHGIPTIESCCGHGCMEGVVLIPLESVKIADKFVVLLVPKQEIKIPYDTETKELGANDIDYSQRHLR